MHAVGISVLRALIASRCNSSTGLDCFTASDTSDKHIKETSTPLSLVSSTFKIAAETCDLKVSLCHHVVSPHRDGHKVYHRLSQSFLALYKAGHWGICLDELASFTSSCFFISWHISEKRNIILIIFGCRSQQRYGISDFKDLTSSQTLYFPVSM